MLNLNVNILHKFVFNSMGEIIINPTICNGGFDKRSEFERSRITLDGFLEKNNRDLFLNIGRFKMLWNKRSSHSVSPADFMM